MGANYTEYLPGKFALNVHVVGGVLILSVKTITVANSPYLVSATDFTVLVDASGGPVAVALPAPLTNTRRIVTVKKIDASANAVAVSGGGGNIDGALFQSLATQWASLMMQTDGTNWFIIAKV